MKYSTEAISKKLERFPDAKLSLEPTPIYRLARLSRHLDQNIYILRDDLSGFGMGGNKVRKLDFLIGDALAKKADTLLTSVASSFSRNAAIAGKTYGFEVHVVLDGSEADQNPASQALFNRVGTVLHYVPDANEASIQQKLDKVLEGLNNEGKSTYLLHPGGSDTIGCLGYIKAFKQIIQHSLDTGIHFNDIIHSTGSTATQAGLVLGQCISGYETRIIGMAASQKTDIQHQRVLTLARQTAMMLNVELDESRIVVDDRFLGPGYALSSKEGTEASKIFAGTDGILMDDTYTAKAAAGLIHRAINGEFGKQDNVLFVHTSGDAGMYY